MAQVRGYIEYATRVGKAEAALGIARMGDDAFKHETEDSIVRRCIWNNFCGPVKVKWDFHGRPRESYHSPNGLVDQITAKVISPDSWTFGQKCGWFAGELDGCHYTVYFKSGNGGQHIRITVNEIDCTCIDCCPPSVY